MSTLSWVIVLLVVVVLAVVALLVQGSQHRSAITSAVALERARQDLLLNRLAARSPGELAAYTAQPEIVAPPAPEREGRYLYDNTGLIRHFEFVDERTPSHAAEL